MVSERELAATALGCCPRRRSKKLGCNPSDRSAVQRKAARMKRTSSGVRPTPSRNWRLLIAVITLTVVGMPSAAVAAVPPDAAALSTRPCGWPVDVSATTLNVAAPDSNTNYFVQPFYLRSGEQITVRGIYPFARYFSFITYDASGEPVNGVSLHDTDISPDSGSVNPFTTGNAPADPSQRRYTVHVVASGSASAGPNTLSAEPGLGFLIYRLYLPDPPITGRVPFPVITIGNRTLPTCTPTQQTLFTKAFRPVAGVLVSRSAPDPSTVATGPSLFRKASDLAGLFPNPDNQYVFEASTYRPGYVVVIRGKAMSHSVTDQPVTTAANVRYWSMCSNLLQNPYPVVDCKADQDTTVDASGYYTYVISMKRDKPSNATAANGMTWLQWAPPRYAANPPTNVTYLRTMLPNPNFHHAVQSVTTSYNQPSLDARAAAESMQDYYPVGTYCLTTTVERQGPNSCFR